MPKPPVVTPTLPSPKVWKTKKPAINDTGRPVEKSIAADSKVLISLCVSQGKVKVNGWDRNEIRAFVNNGTQLGFKVREKSAKSGNPLWVLVLAFDPSKEENTGADECLSGEEIELDVPRGARVELKSGEGEIKIDSITKARVENLSGSIFLNNIEQGIEAKTYQGDVMVGNSTGAMMLTSTTGNIIAFDVNPGEIGDYFKAKTNNGAITLQQVAHRQTEINSNSGAIRFNGEFRAGGQYRFGTLNGSITLAIPEKSSCNITASYGFGAFNSEIPLQNVKKNAPNGGAQNLSGQLGSGEATLNLTTYNGRINIKKQ